MRLAVLSDIHGNLTALETALADLDSVGGADLTWCLGDLAAFGPRPAECIRRVKALADANEGKTFKVIGGNTDRYMVTGERFPLAPAADEAALKQNLEHWKAFGSSLLWAVEQISFEDYEYLKQLIGRELADSFDGCHVIGYHAVPGHDETFLLPETPDEAARDLLLDREGHLAIGGHTHRQMDRDLRGWRAVNVGSVGASVDRPGYVQWGLFTFDNGQVTVDLRNVPYDVESVIADLRAVGYPAPDWTASRLRPA